MLGARRYLDATREVLQAHGQPVVPRRILRHLAQARLNDGSHARRPHAAARRPPPRAPPRRHRRRRRRAGRLRLAGDGRRHARGRAPHRRAAAGRHAGLRQSSAAPRARAHAAGADRAARGRPRAGAACRGPPHRLARGGAGVPRAGRAAGRREQGAADRRRCARARWAPTPTAPQLLREGFFAGCGVQQVGLPGYPEGHPRIATATLAAALGRQARRWPRQQGLGPTSSRSSPSRPTASSNTAPTSPAARPGVPVYVGLAGPTSPVALLRYSPSAAASAPRCARCRRRACARCASSPTSTPPTS